MPGFQAVPWGGYQDKMACEHEMKMLTFKDVLHMSANGTTGLLGGMQQILCKRQAAGRLYEVEERVNKTLVGAKEVEPNAG